MTGNRPASYELRSLYGQPSIVVHLHLLLVLDFSPGQLAVGELHHHVEERPEVIVAT